jgi:hypothetical protein
MSSLLFRSTTRSEGYDAVIETHEHAGGFKEP